MALPLDAAARAVRINETAHAEVQETVTRNWDRGAYAEHDPDTVERAYRQAEAAIRAAVTKDVLTAVLGDHAVSENAFGMDGARQVSCACGDWSFDVSLNPSWAAWEAEHDDHVADAMIAALTTSDKG